jgi:glycosyltransferase involved in cell wall biosynthesis
MTITKLDSWQKEEEQLIHQNFEIFHNIVLQARSYLQCNNYEMAAVYADMADEYASWMGHCGLFASQEIEQILLIIGKQAIRTNHCIRKESLSCETPKKVLHVVHNVWSIGGHSRLLWRWIRQDKKRSHSVVFTRMSVKDTPEALRKSVLDTGGELYEISKESLISRAKQLRKIAALSDIVILHTICDSPIATIAFANREQSPPIIYVNHADERFWTGVSVSDVVANLRESGMRLSQTRRGVEPKRNLLLPTILESSNRVLSRLEAKKQLGIDENDVLLLSIARGVKYKTSDGSNFAAAHVELLKQYPQAILIVVGPGDSEDWSAAVEQTQGRIRVLSETPQTTLFYQAADIYVDSYPFVSITSLLEAGSYGVPLVSRYPYSTDACEIFGADMPGLTGNLIRVQNLEEYKIVLSNLIENEEFRLSLGARTRKQIEEIHIGSNWQLSLERIYSHAVTIPPLEVISFPQDRASIGEPDILLQKVCPFIDVDFDKLIRDRVRLMPFNKRFSFWLRQIKKGDFGRTGNVSFLLPEWLYGQLVKLVKF